MARKQGKFGVAAENRKKYEDAVRLLQSGECKSKGDACKKAGITWSVFSYYRKNDKNLTPSSPSQEKKNRKPRKLGAQTKAPRLINLTVADESPALDGGGEVTVAFVKMPIGKLKDLFN